MDLIAFERYIEKRFGFKETIIKIEYIKLPPFTIIEEWKNIIEYIAYKYPLAKALLKGSIVNIDGNNVNINLALKGKDILETRRFDQIIAETMMNLYNQKCNVKFVEKPLEDIMLHLQEQNKKLEEEYILTIKNQEKESKKEKIEEKKEEIKESPKQVIEEKQEENSPLIYGRSVKLKETLVKVADLSVDSGRVLLDGEILNIDSRELKSGKLLAMFDLYDGTSTITCKAFLEKEKAKEILGKLSGVRGVKVEGTAQFDPFAKELGVIANTIIEGNGIKREKREDNAPIKRVELHMHTQMSQMDGMTSAKDLIKRAVKWGMKSIAITDHGVVQAFPEAHKYLEKDHPDIKILYGVEAYLAPDKVSPISFSKNQSLDNTTYCVLDLETTGISFRTEKITEVGIMKIRNGELLDSFSCFVNPEKPIPQKVVEVTNITDDMVKDADTIDKVLPKVIEFIGDSVLVAHNADFDIGFLKYNATALGLKLNNTYIDTLKLAKELFPQYKKYKLGIIAENLGIKVDVAHRALDDVDTTVKVFNIMLDMLKEQGVKTLDDIDKKNREKQIINHYRHIML